MGKIIETEGDKLMRENSKHIAEKVKEDLTKVTFKELHRRVKK